MLTAVKVDICQTVCVVGGGMAGGGMEVEVNSVFAELDQYTFPNFSNFTPYFGLCHQPRQFIYFERL